MADFNALKLEAGYCASLGGNAWDEEARIPTRLSEDAATVYLAVWRDGELAPYIADERYPWDLSSVHVSARRVPDVKPCKAVLELQKSQRQLQEAIVLALRPQGEGLWLGDGLPDSVAYHATLGLLFGDELAWIERK